MAKISATWMRGGSSKCWIFRREDLPEDSESRDRLISRLFGSPDLAQIDGIGGATTVTSKVIVIDSARETEGKVDYQFGQVVIDDRRVEWVSNCGNCATALGLYAAQEGLGRVANGRSQVQLSNTVTGLELTTAVELSEGVVPNDGPVFVSGVMYPGVGVNVRFSAPSWTSRGKGLLPSGREWQPVFVGKREAAATFIDAGTPAVFVSGADLGLDVKQANFEDQLGSLVNQLRETRSAARDAVPGWVTGAGESIPKIGVVLPAWYDPSVDLIVRMLSMDKLHPVISITSAVAVAVASTLDGSVVAECVKASSAGNLLRIGTRRGVVEAERVRDGSGGVVAVEIRRNARRLADADLAIPA